MDWNELFQRYETHVQDLQRVQTGLNSPVLDIEIFQVFRNKLLTSVLPTCVDDYGYAIYVAFDKWTTTDFKLSRSTQSTAVEWQSYRDNEAEQRRATLEK